MNYAATLLRRVLLSATSLLLTLYCHAAGARDVVAPAYFYPDPAGSGWDSLTLLAKQVPTTAVANPNSGPGRSFDPNYAAAIARMHAAGGKVIGYVSSSWGNRRLSDVTNDINAYRAMYQLDGFFIDEMTTDTGAQHLQYYQSLYNYIKALSPAYSVMGNPGAGVPQQYAALPLADRFVIFEGNAKQFKRMVPAGWQSGYPAQRFVSIVYATAKQDQATILQLNTARNLGGLFLTSLTMPDPYYKLPKNWGIDMAAVYAAP